MRVLSKKQIADIREKLDKKLASFTTHRIDNFSFCVKSSDGKVITVINDYEINSEHEVPVGAMFCSSIFDEVMMCIGIDQSDNINTWFISESADDGVIIFPNMKEIANFEGVGFIRIIEDAEE